MRISLLFDHLGPYHRARLQAAAQVVEIQAIEVAGKSGDYAWKADGAEKHINHVTWVHHNTSRSLTRTELLAKARETLANFRPDAVVIPGWSARAAIALCIEASRCHLPVVVMSESNAFDEKRSPSREWVKRRIVGRCACALVGGQAHRDYLRELGMAGDRIFLGYDAVDNGYFDQKAKAARSQGSEVRRQSGLPERYFLASARFIEKKNLSRLLQAYARYRQLAADSAIRNPPFAIWSLVLLGDGPLRSDLCRLITDLSLPDFVHLPGFKQYPELPVYYGLAGAFIHASTVEQWGLVVNEAMASGLPVLVSNRCGCAPDLVQDGINGFSFDPENVGQLANLMLTVSAMDDSSPDRPCCSPAGEGGRWTGEGHGEAANAGSGRTQGEVLSLTSMGNASRRIVSHWGPNRFAQGLSAAVEKAIEVGPIKPGMLDRILLSALLRR